MTPDQRTIAMQRERIEELEEELRQARELLAPKRIFPRQWKLEPAQQRLLSAMLDAPGGYIELNRAFDIATRNTDGVDIHCIRVQMHGMRKKLTPFGIGIVTRWGCGYELTAPSKAIIKAALAQRLAA